MFWGRPSAFGVSKERRFPSPVQLYNIPPCFAVLISAHFAASHWIRECGETLETVAVLLEDLSAEVSTSFSTLSIFQSFASLEERKVILKRSTNPPCLRIYTSINPFHKVSFNHTKTLGRKNRVWKTFFRRDLPPSALPQGAGVYTHGSHKPDC